MTPYELTLIVILEADVLPSGRRGWVEPDLDRGGQRFQCCPDHRTHLFPSESAVATPECGDRDRPNPVPLDRITRAGRPVATSSRRLAERQCRFVGKLTIHRGPQAAPVSHTNIRPTWRSPLRAARAYSRNMSG